MRLLYFGSSDFGIPTFAHLRARHEAVGMVSQPDRPAGRRRLLTPTPAAAWAEAEGIETIKAENANDVEVVEQVSALNADMGIVIAYGQKMSAELIAASGRLVINLHGSLLPKYRGAGPINHAVLNGETETGVCVIGIAPRMDAGEVYGSASLAIDPRETAGELHDRLALLGPELMERMVDEFVAGTLKAEVQDESLVTRAPKLRKSDGVVDFDASPDEVRCRIHGLTPWPGVRVTWRSAATGDEQPLLLRRVESVHDAEHDAAPGTVLPGDLVAVRGGAVRLLEVQPPGKRVMSIADFEHGHKLQPGDVLSSGS